VTDSGASTPPGGSDSAAPQSEPRPEPRESLVVPRHPSGRPRSARHETSGDYLGRALRAKDSTARRALAEAGLVRLDQEDDDDPEMEALLLRQLYLADLEEGDLEAALHTASDMVELGTLGDIARQDAARAAAALGEIELASDHLRIAANVCPPERRAFHLATLGALLRFTGHPAEAVEVFQTAAACAEKDRFLYLGQWALAEKAAGREPTWSLADLRQGLERAPGRKGYSLWVLGELCSLLGDQAAGARYLESFLGRLEGAPRAKSLALAGEVAHARQLLEGK
jgi:Tfp pilus assembly protein PilF